MCWSTKRHENVQLIVAEKGIKVLKFLVPCEMGLASPYYKYYYTTGVLCPKIDLICHGRSLQLNTWILGTILDGYHSYQNEKCNILCSIDYNDDAVMNLVYENSVKRKFYGSINEPKYTLYECIIPKGTKYYVNEYHEVVSETIIFRRLKGAKPSLCCFQ